MAQLKLGNGRERQGRIVEADGRRLCDVFLADSFQETSAGPSVSEVFQIYVYFEFR